ncbi:MAG: phosphoribosylaminoimidazolesuccinocarboxamide synthase [Bacteroidia bacterium]|nr:MAG: phosphoribosylaminoimidazolesuccinocarboxamide synthase [Bacteroidia bacterium]
MQQAVLKTDFQFTGQQSVYHGKVRDVYTLKGDLLAMVVSDRLSAFDVVMPWGIPGKGQVLNMIAAVFLDATRDILPNWKLAVPDPMVTVGYRCETYPVEMVVRGYLSGHAWREYKAGRRELCGVALPEGLRENEQLPTPIITPTTKAAEGHDEDISRGEIIARGIVSEAEYVQLEEYALALFARGTEMAARQGLILVDTKYEFGRRQGQIMLIDEIHTPDSSRYFYSEGYHERLEKGQAQRQLSKEFVRQWLMESGFSGQEGQQIPALTPERQREITSRYVELYEQITGGTFEVALGGDPLARIERNVEGWIHERGE